MDFVMDQNKFLSMNFLLRAGMRDPPWNQGIPWKIFQKWPKFFHSHALFRHFGKIPGFLVRFLGFYAQPLSCLFVINPKSQILVKIWNSHNTIRLVS